MATKQSIKKDDFDLGWAIGEGWDFFYNDYLYEGLTMREMAGLIQERIDEEHGKKVSVRTILGELVDMQ